MKIVIVEDEIRIREGLSKLIRKIAPEHRICGEAENGMEGMKLIEQELPDLVLSDIRMPDMDGLAMVKELREKGILFYALFITAYAEFSYAQKAIDLGASGYLLKPISVTTLKETFKKIEKQRNRNSIRGVIRPEMLGSLEHIFGGLLKQNLRLTRELENYLEEGHCLKIEGKYTLVPIYLGQEYEAHANRMIRELNIILTSREDIKYQLIKLPEDFLFVYVIYSCKNIAELERWFQNHILMRLIWGKKYHMSIGWITVQGIDRLKEGMETIREYLHWNIVLGDQVMISYPKIKNVQAVGVSYPVDLEEQVRQALCMKNAKKSEDFVNKFQKYYKKDQLFDPKVIKDHYIRFSLSIRNMLSELNYSSVQDIRQQELIEYITKAVMGTELSQVIERVLRMAIQENNDENEENSAIIQKFKSLAHGYYGDGITLGEISRRLGMTSEYLGTLFKKEEGIHFNTYMKNYRVQKAKEILLGTNLKLYEVAEKVGYADPKYFSRVFKEVTGYLPVEYRKIKR